MTKISIIIPAYNVEKYIKQCIESVLQQSLKEIEIIIVDDESKDNTVKIIEEIKDERIKLIKQKNGGVSNARNVGTALAKGKYLFYLDSDDFLEEGALELLFECAEKFELDVVIGKTYKFNENNQKKNIIEEYDTGEKIMTGIEYLEHFMSEKTLTSVWNKLLKTDFIKQNEIGNPTGIHMGEDAATLVHIFLYAKKIKQLNIVTYNYRFNPNGIMSSGRYDSLVEGIKCYKYVDRLLNLSEYKFSEEFILNFKYRFLYQNFFSKAYFSKKIQKNNEYKKIYKKIQKDSKILIEMSKSNLSSFEKKLLKYYSKSLIIGEIARFFIKKKEKFKISLEKRMSKKNK